jgi:Holliday junction resolvase
VLLISQIKRCEKNIIRLKSISQQLKISLRHDRPSKTAAQGIKKKIKATAGRVDEYQHTIFLLKCFGDGIANIYLDKYALKHTFFNVNDVFTKETAGFITGKEGFHGEWKIVKESLRKGWPVLLCDITNVLRHGDVCALFGPDPLLVEVKSSKNRNNRIKRQLQHLEQLHNFFLNDGADTICGVPNVRRRELHVYEINHVNAINECIERSYINGSSCMSPERGIHYVCNYYNFNADELREIINESSVFFTLNEIKSNDWWGPYYPFTLSLRPNHLTEFIYGNIFLIVIIDLNVVKDLFFKKGIHATILSDADYVLQISRNTETFEGGVARISKNFFLRIPLEFQSLQWFVDEFSLRLDNDIAKAETGPLIQIPDSWYSAGD